MKFLFVIALAFGINDSNAQNKELVNLIDKTIFLKVNTTVPIENLHDSCYFMSTLLKISIDKKNKVNSIFFSDSAPQWLVDELTKAKKRIDVAAIEAYAKKEKIKKVDLVFPFVIRSIPFKCGNGTFALAINDEKYFSFTGEKLNGVIKFCDTLEHSFYYHF